MQSMQRLRVAIFNTTYVFDFTHMTQCPGVKRFIKSKLFHRITRNLTTGIHSNCASARPSSVQACCKHLEQLFEDHRISEAEISAELIVAHVMGHKTLHGVSRNQVISRRQWKTGLNLASRRLLGMPMQYVIEEWDFGDFTLQMKPPVFIPRPETEELVSLALDDPCVIRARRFLEVGCGSGAISLALLKALPEVYCTAVDCSQVACELTLDNAAKVGVADRITVRNYSLTPDNARDGLNNKFDFLISNPPYIKTEDLQHLQPELRFEDMGALDGGEDGMGVVSAILQVAPLILNQAGSVWLEVDSSHPSVIEHVTTARIYRDLHYKQTYHDFANLSQVFESGS